jgi:hypothetical protein
MDEKIYTYSSLQIKKLLNELNIESQNNPAHSFEKESRGRGSSRNHKNTRN